LSLSVSCVGRKIAPPGTSCEGGSLKKIVEHERDLAAAYLEGTIHLTVLLQRLDAEEQWDDLLLGALRKKRAEAYHMHVLRLLFLIRKAQPMALPNKRRARAEVIRGQPLGSIAAHTLGSSSPHA
jgi:hypothetical protein